MGNGNFGIFILNFGIFAQKFRRKNSEISGKIKKIKNEKKGMAWIIISRYYLD